MSFTTYTNVVRYANNIVYTVYINTYTQGRVFSGIAIGINSKNRAGILYSFF